MRWQLDSRDLHSAQYNRFGQEVDGGADGAPGYVFMLLWAPEPSTWFRDCILSMLRLCILRVFTSLRQVLSTCVAHTIFVVPSTTGR